MNQQLRQVMEVLGGVASRQELLAAGVSRGVIGSAVRRGSLTRVAPGLFAGGPGGHAAEPYRRALAHAGPGAALSHLTAAQLWGLRRGPVAPVHVTVAHGRRRRDIPGVVVHQSSVLDPVRNGNWPLTCPRQTLIDLASCLDAAELSFPVLKAVHRGLVPRASLEDLSGVPTQSWDSWRRVAAEARAGALSGGEAAYWRLLRESGLPMPLLNRRVRTAGRTYVVDALWADHQLGAEIDGREYHALAAAFDADHDRQNEIHATGLVLIRFGVGKVLSQPAEVLRVTEANLMARAAQLGLTP